MHIVLQGERREKKGGKKKQRKQKKTKQAWRDPELGAPPPHSDGSKMAHSHHKHHKATAYTDTISMQKGRKAMQERRCRGGGKDAAILPISADLPATTIYLLSLPPSRQACTQPYSLQRRTYNWKREGWRQQPRTASKERQFCGGPGG